MKSVWLVIALVVLSACSKAPVASPTPAVLAGPAKEERNLYWLGLRYLANGDYVTAASKLEQLLKTYPTTRWLSSAYYNLGLAYEGQGRLEEAVVMFKNVVDFHQGVHSRDEAEALYRLSICYEKLGQDDKIVIVLLQLKEMLNYLPRDTAQTEIPARLAAAYARQGHQDEAQGYYNQVSAALKKLRRTKVEGDLTAWYPKALYSMGRLPLLKKDLTAENYKNYLTPLIEGQAWLLRAAESGENIWAEKAATELNAVLLDAWQKIDTVPLDTAEADKLLAMKQRQDQQKAMAADLDVVLSRLQLERLPSLPYEKESPRVSEIFKTVLRLQANVDRLLQTRDVQDRKTFDAESREGARGDGRINSRSKKK